VVVKNKQLI